MVYQKLSLVTFDGIPRLGRVQCLTANPRSLSFVADTSRNMDYWYGLDGWLSPNETAINNSWIGWARSPHQISDPL
jgi:hypothetical protein